MMSFFCGFGKDVDGIEVEGAGERREEEVASGGSSSPHGGGG